MMELLEKEPDRGYPTDYLIARLRGRRPGLIKDWGVVIANRGQAERNLPERFRAGLRAGLEKEFRFVYRQMNDALKKIFYFYFCDFELNTLFCALRLKTKSGREERISNLLENSILSVPVKCALQGGGPVQSSLERLEEIFKSEEIVGLSSFYLKGGLREVERRIKDFILEQGVKEASDPVIKSFFIYLINSRNILIAYKMARWGIGGDPGFLPGGDIGEERLRKALDRDLAGVVSLARDFSGVKNENAAEITVILLHGLTLLSNIWRKESYDVGFMLDYLLRLRLEARSLGLTLEGDTLESELLRGEMVF
jgi:hypothetical protein